MIAAPLRVSSAPNGALSSSSSSSSRSRSRSRIRCSAAPSTGRGASTPYEELGLRAGATAREIKAAYRRLARERHPDVAGAPAADDFVRLHRAYAALSDLTAGGSGRRPRRTWETDQCW